MMRDHRDHHDQDTRRLIEGLKAKRRRRKTQRVLWLLAVGVIVVAAIAVGLVLALGSSGTPAPGSTANAAGGSPTTARSTTTAGRGSVTTERTAPTERPPSDDTGSTTASEPTTTSEPATTSTTNWLSTKVVVVDPGHQAKADYGMEPIGPGSATTKARVSSGTQSPTTGTPESEVTLAISLKLRDALAAKGIRVIMTRETQDVAISNRERAQVGNNAHADLAVRLHCNGSGDSTVHGLFTIYPASIEGWTDDIATVSKQAAAIVQAAAIAATGAKDRGLSERSDLTGFNWSDVPDVLVEMGFMSNPAEDKLLESGTYQDKMVQGLVNGIIEFLRTQS
jgi:N-acetylmuramoyl-L-alanine amidase